MVRTLSILLVAGACAAPEPDAVAVGATRGPVEPPDYAALCGETWVPDTCIDGVCSTYLEPQHHAEAFVQAFQEAHGWSDEVVAEHVRVRHVALEPYTKHGYRVHAEVTFDWATVLLDAVASAEGQRPSYDEVLEAWRLRVPEVGLDPEAQLALVPEAIEDAVDACEEETGAPLDRAGWCFASVTVPEARAQLLTFTFEGEPVPANSVNRLEIDALRGTIGCGWGTAWVE